MKREQLTKELIGRRIKSDIYSDDGHLLLNEGTIISYNILSKLERHAINTIELLNAITSDIKAVGIINDELMTESMEAVETVFNNVLKHDANGVSAAIPPEHMALVEEIVDHIIEALKNAGNLLFTVSEMLEQSTYTYKHSVNVSILSILTAKALNYKEEDIKNIALGAFLHDIGKMMVPQELITKPEALTEEERKEVNRHSEYGYKLVKNIDSLPFSAKQIVLLHHEKLDGTGYPYGLKGMEIPEYVRIVTLCDMYDAMTTDRIYRGKMPIYTVLEILMADSVYKLDRNIYRHMTENICIHPPGSGVVLSDGRIGVVSSYRPTNPSRPHVRVIDFNSDITNIQVENVNLEKIKTIFVVDTWDVSSFRKGLPLNEHQQVFGSQLPQITKEDLLKTK